MNRIIPSYPFSAIVGQERMKLALLLNVINPTIGGVLIRGQRGTAKSTAVRALASLLPEQEVTEGCRYGCSPAEPCLECLNTPSGSPPLSSPRGGGKRQMRIVELPINASEDRVVGSIDLEAALSKGEVSFAPGVLAEANRNLMYVDEVNLLDDHIVDVLLDAAAMGVNVVEREGMSVSHPSRFILVGTMNPEEGELRPQLLDRFGLCVDVEAIDQPEQRVEIIQRRTEWEENPSHFLAEYSVSEEQLRKQIAEAILNYSEVQIPASILALIAQLSIALKVEGHRADLVCARAAQVQAARNGRVKVTPEEVNEVAELVYAHRVPQTPFMRHSPKISEVISRVIGEVSDEASR